MTPLPLGCYWLYKASLQRNTGISSSVSRLHVLTPHRVLSAGLKLVQSFAATDRFRLRLYDETAALRRASLPERIVCAEYHRTQHEIACGNSRSRCVARLARVYIFRVALQWVATRSSAVPG